MTFAIFIFLLYICFFSNYRISVPQTYTQNVQHFEEDTDSPIFIYVGDGGHFTTEWLVRGHMFDIAADLKAALVTADHRYYGQNIPMPTASFDDLQFLTVDQALADLAILIDHVRENLRTSGRVILWGTGYGGALAANARKKFPHLVDGVWASSAYFRAEDIDWCEYYCLLLFDDEIERSNDIRIHSLSVL